ncbi:DUF551 domain-containing protein [Enterobacter hormaechei]|uniref:DUF551 domain-containing protein n=1 Tax=Enterobacter hormaechei TaxID=158836 RepID=UPI00079B6E92|nr:DUF551 domain-containing protein [Enterobacter hormaechei]SAG97431.1 Protein of uncharacterised function (DUF551) [Enterobacter hormaechei]
MSTITNKFTKEQLQQIEAAAKEVMWPVVWSEKKAREHFSEKITPKVVLKLARIALASLEAEPVAWLLSGGGAKNNVSFDSGNAYADPLREVTPLYTAPPAPVSVPAAMEMDDDFDSAFEHGKAVGWNAYRAAMLQGADRPQNEPQNIPENIPATQFKPVADLYGLTSPTGGETSFTFDAVEARDFIDGDWLCQEYVELERFQEAITNHTEDKLAMVDHSGDSNNMVESVTTACELRDVVDAIRNSGIAIDGEKILAERDALNSPVIPDGWVACSDRMPEQFKAILAFNEYGEVWSGAYDRYWNFYCDNLLVEHVTHWMTLPNPPKE